MNGFVAMVVIYALLMMGLAAAAAILVSLLWVIGLGIASLLHGHQRQEVR
jgi:hypothetical protein